MNVLHNLRQKGRHAHRVNLWALGRLVSQRDGVGDHNPLERGRIDACHGSLGKHPVDAHRFRLARPESHDRLRGRTHLGPGIHHVIVDDDGLAAHIPHHHGIPLAGFPFVVNDGQGQSKLFRQEPGPSHPGRIRSHHHTVFAGAPAELFHEKTLPRNVVHGQSKKPLNLSGMERTRHDPVHPRRGQQIGHHLGRNGHPGLVLLVSSPIAVIRNHRIDARRRRPFEGVHHEQKFHEVVVDRPARGLDHISIHPADVLADFHPDFSIGKARHQGFAEG